jgi:hypothetical protein
LLFLLQTDYETTQDKRLLNRTVDELLRMQEIYLWLVDIDRREDGINKLTKRKRWRAHKQHGNCS